METELQPRTGRRLLSPAELLATRARDHKIPQRSHGQKDFIPDGSKEQEESLRQCREEQWQLLEEERVERWGRLVKAEWKPKEGIVELKSPAGKFWQTMGFTENGKQFLLPEEALYLLECGSVQLFYKQQPLSIQEAYETLLPQRSVSLLKYQVFSHLKRLGYIVLRFHPSSVPTSYKRQLNRDNHCKSTEKRKRSSSPRLHEKKTKATEKSQKCKKLPKKSKRNHESSRHSASDGSSLKERTKESDPGMLVVLPACNKDHKDRSIRTSWESQEDTSPCRWDFTTIVFPNLGADHPQTLLTEPDKRLLPENVMAREIDAASWRRKLNQKHERRTHKERKLLEWESRYKSNINDDKEIRHCSTWQEYKALLKERRQWKERSFPSHLWEQSVTPLVNPNQRLVTADVLQRISVLQPSHILDGASQLQNNSKGMKIDFNVYQADAASSFKKNDPGKPYVRMCVRRLDEQIPSLRVVKQLAFQDGDVPLVFAVVDNGEVAFYTFKEFKLPIDISY